MDKLNGGSRRFIHHPQHFKTGSFKGFQGYKALISAGIRGYTHHHFNRPIPFENQIAMFCDHPFDIFHETGHDLQHG